MNVLVTGNLGYVGSELTSYLRNKEKKIIPPVVAFLFRPY